MATDGFRIGTGRPGVQPLADRSWLVLGVAVVPVVVTSLLFVVHSLATGTPQEAYGLPMAYLLYGLANVAVVVGLYAFLSPADRSAVFRFRRPSGHELLWAAGAFPVGLGVFVAVDRIMAGLGYQVRGLSYSLASPTTVAIVTVGAVVIAPITEEILYRGLVLGKFLSEGWGGASAVAATTVLFAGIHLPNFGVAGTAFVSVWGVLPAILRLRFDNLSGAVALHAANNAYAYLLVVALGLY
jgi:membrane protease YdiL (CAAX protease family)